MTKVREFLSGATRDTNEGKLDPEGFNSPIVELEFAKYMHKHRKQSDDKLRASDNWQKGIGKDVYAESMGRHYLVWWLEHRGFNSRDGIIDALCGLRFNVNGYLFEILKGLDIGEIEE